MTILSDTDLERYFRQLIIPEVGKEGQKKLSDACVLVVGAGGLGSPVLLYLAAAGVGTIGIADSDSVEISNLQRQILYRDEDIGGMKAVIAAERIRALNPGINTITYPFRLAGDNIGPLIQKYDLAIDCCDNFATRYLLSDATEKAGKPMVYGAVYQFCGQASVFNYKGGPSYRKLFPEEIKNDEPTGASPVGVIGALPGIIGSVEVSETLKIILGQGEVLSGKLLQIDSLNLRFDLISF